MELWIKELKSRLSFYKNKLKRANKETGNAWEVIGLESLIEETEHQLYDAKNRSDK